MATEPPIPSASSGAPVPFELPTDPAQESLVRALRASFNILRVLMIVLVVLYLLSGVFRVDPGQQGLVARLGKLREVRNEEGELTPVFAPGWYWALPDPFDQKYILTGQVQKLVVTHFLFTHDQAATTRNLAEILMPKPALVPGVDGAMITGDTNLSHGRWEVQYTIKDAALFVQNVGGSAAEFEPLLERLTETAVVREVAGRTVEQVTRTALDAVRRGVQKRLQDALDRLETGVHVDQIVAHTIEPGAVRPAFLDVINAENEKLTSIREADQKASEILNRAAGGMHAEILEKIRAYGRAQLDGADQARLRPLLGAINDKLIEARDRGAGQVAVELRKARAEANAISEGLRRDFELFTKRLQQRKAQPRITVLDLWVQMRNEVFSHKENEVFFVPDSDEIEILINRDPLRQRELEEERTLRRQRGEQ